MSHDILAPYQQLAHTAWHALQPQWLDLDPALAPMLAHHFQSTGKLLRPALTLAFYEQLLHGEHSEMPNPPTSIIQMAIALELLHNATLIHDDLQDGDEYRRGVPTVWKAFDAYQAINAGSALYFHALRLLANLDIEPQITRLLCQLLADQTLAIIGGQALEKQLWAVLERPDAHHDPLALYLRVVEKKTSALFALPMMSAALLASRPLDELPALEAVARPLGALFQIQDDILDLYGQKGRDTVGNDIAEGKPSYLALYALQHAPQADRERLYTILRAPRLDTSPEDIAWSLEMLRGCGALRAALQKIDDLQQQAITALPPALPQEPLSPQRFILALCEKIMQPIHPIQLHHKG
jgi:geranylgeranyl pyrophosphate synthase